MHVFARKGNYVDVTFRLSWRFAVFLLSAFSGLQISRAYRPKQESTKHGSAATLTRPGFVSSAGCYSPWLPGERGTPLAPGGLGRGRTVSHPPALPANNFEAPPLSTKKERTDPRAHAACNRRVFRRTNSASRDAQPAHLAARNPHASSGAQPVRLPARKRRVLRRATGASSGAQLARLPARNRRVLRCAPGASSDAHPARLEARSRQASAACEVFAF